MADTPQDRPKPDDDTRSPAKDAPLDDRSKTPGDGTLQDATPTGLSSEELRKRAEDSEGTVQPGTG